MSGGNLQSENSLPVNSEPGRRAKSGLPEILPSRSSDSLASILTADPEGEYARIALWLTTASEQDIATYWAGYKGGKRTVPVTDLVFLNWTRRNPQAATAAVAGTDDERYAWWSWAANDPAAALAAAKDGGDERMVQVACGIGDFNPAWLQAHLDQIPEAFRGEAFGRMRNWPAGQDPLAGLNFMKENGVGFDAHLFKSLVQKDPWLALDWMKENPNAGYDPFGRGNPMLDLLVSTMSREQPEDLERLAAQTPGGEQKRAMEKALFDRLLETDPEAALEQARKLEAPLIAAQRLGQVGLSLLATDPDRAIEIAREILKANPANLDIQQWVDYPGGSSTSGTTTGPATELFIALFARDRQQTLELMAAHAGGQDDRFPILNQYASKWADEDLTGFTRWIDEQQDPKVAQQAKRVVGYQLAQQGNYLESIEWMRSADPGKSMNLFSPLYSWRQSDPEAAAAWLESSDLSQAEKDEYQKTFKQIDR